MRITLSSHARKRMRERNVSREDIEHVLSGRATTHPSPRKRTFRGRSLGGARNIADSTQALSGSPDARVRNSHKVPNSHGTRISQRAARPTVLKFTVCCDDALVAPTYWRSGLCKVHHLYVAVIIRHEQRIIEVSRSRFSEDDDWRSFWIVFTASCGSLDFEVFVYVAVYDISRLL